MSRENVAAFKRGIEAGHEGFREALREVYSATAAEATR